MDSEVRKLALWSLPLGMASLIGVAGASVWLAVQRHDAWFVMGLFPAVIFFAAALVAGWRTLPRWATRTAATCLCAGAAVFALAGLALQLGRGGWLSQDIGGFAGAMAGGIGLAFIFLVGGWVYTDARERGLNAGLWATIAIVGCPYLIGPLAYLIGVVLRDQRLLGCGACGATVPVGAAYCPKCGAPLQPVCPHCGARGGAGDRFCTACGKIRVSADMAR